MKKQFLIALVGLLIVGCVAVKPTPKPAPTPPPLPTVPSKPMMKAMLMVGLTRHTNAPTLQVGFTNIIATQGDTVTMPFIYQWLPTNSPTFPSVNITVTNIQPSQAGIYSTTLTNKGLIEYSTVYVSVGATNILPQCLPPNGMQTVNLSWCQPDTNGVMTLSGYNIYYGTGLTTNWMPDVYDTNIPCGLPISLGTNWLRSYTNMVTVGVGTGATLTNIVPGVTNYYACTAIGANGIETSLSEEIAFAAPLYLNLTNSFPIQMTHLGPMTVQLSAKVSPISLLSVLTRNDLLNGQWTVIASNLPPDSYGNFFYTDYAANDKNFYRLEIQ